MYVGRQVKLFRRDVTVRHVYGPYTTFRDSQLMRLTESVSSKRWLIIIIIIIIILNKNPRIKKYPKVEQKN